MLTDHKGKVRESYAYDAFGVAYEGQFQRVNEYGYNGKRLDPAVGLYDYGFRDYKPMLGRFTTLDPIRDSFNWYVYCNNDPINFTNPLGLLPETPGTGTATEPEPQIDLPEGILGQNDPALANIPSMPESGCNFRSCQAVAETHVGEALTAEQITESVEDLQESGALGEDMAVNNPDAVINDAFDRLGQPDVTATVGWGGGDSEPDATIIWGTTPNDNSHAQLGDSGGNEIWDPYDPDIDVDVTNINDVFIHGGN